jgi:hypothetical protein
LSEGWGGGGGGFRGPWVNLRLWVEGPLKLSIFSNANINYTDIQEPVKSFKNLSFIFQRFVEPMLHCVERPSHVKYSLISDWLDKVRIG